MDERHVGSRGKDWLGWKLSWMLSGGWDIMDEIYAYVSSWDMDTVR